MCVAADDVFVDACVCFSPLQLLCVCVGRWVLLVLSDLSLFGWKVGSVLFFFFLSFFSQVPFALLCFACWDRGVTWVEDAEGSLKGLGELGIGC